MRVNGKQVFVGAMSALMMATSIPTPALAAEVAGLGLQENSEQAQAQLDEVASKAKENAGAASTVEAGQAGTAGAGSTAESGQVATAGKQDAAKAVGTSEADVAAAASGAQKDKQAGAAAATDAEKTEPAAAKAAAKASTASAKQADDGIDVTFVIQGLPGGTPGTTISYHMDIEGTIPLPNLDHSADDPTFGNTDPKVDGYTWVGRWYTDAACTQPFNAARLVTSDLTLYTRYDGPATPTAPAFNLSTATSNPSGVDVTADGSTNSYSISKYTAAAGDPYQDADGNWCVDVFIDPAKALNFYLPAGLAKGDYELDTAASKLTATFRTEGASGTTYKLAWKRDGGDQASLVFKKKAAAPQAAQVHIILTDEASDRVVNANVGDKLSSLDDWQETPARDGYTFKGWNTKADGTGDTVTGETAIPTPYFAVYAQWETVRQPTIEANDSATISVDQIAGKDWDEQVAVARKALVKSATDASGEDAADKVELTFMKDGSNGSWAFGNAETGDYQVVLSLDGVSKTVTLTVKDAEPKAPAVDVSQLLNTYGTVSYKVEGGTQDGSAPYLDVAKVGAAAGTPEKQEDGTWRVTLTLEPAELAEVLLVHGWELPDGTTAEDFQVDREASTLTATFETNEAGTSWYLVPGQGIKVAFVKKPTAPVNPSEPGQGGQTTPEQKPETPAQNVSGRHDDGATAPAGKKVVAKHGKTAAASKKVLPQTGDDNGTVMLAAGALGVAALAAGSFEFARRRTHEE